MKDAPMPQPVVKVKPTVLDWILDAAGVVLLLAMWVVVLYFYPTLPARIPTHFGPDGQPDAFGSKSVLLILAATDTILYAFIFLAARFPHWGNYPVKVTEENAWRLYRYAASLLRELGVGMNVMFLWLVTAICRIATNQANGLGGLFLPYVLVMMLAPTTYYMIRMVMTK